MMTDSEGDGRGACSIAAPVRSRLQRHPRRAGHAALLFGVPVVRCSGEPMMSLHAAVRPLTPRVPVPARTAWSLARVLWPDHSDPASVAEAFCIAWASVDSLHRGPYFYVARCTSLATASLDQQRITAAWPVAGRGFLAGLVRVRAVSRDDGALAPGTAATCLRVYAQRVHVAGRTTSSDGVAVQLTRSGGHWLASRLVLC